MRNRFEDGSRGSRNYKMIHDAGSGIIFSEKLPLEDTSEADVLRALAKSMQPKGEGGSPVPKRPVVHNDCGG